MFVKRFIAPKPQAWHRYCVGNLQRRASAAINRAEAARLNHEGMSEESIGKRLGVTPKTVRVYLHDFLKSDCRFPVTMSVSDVELLRAQQRSNVEAQMRALSRRMVELEPDPDIFEERVRAAEVAAKISDAFGRQVDRLAAMFGLNAAMTGPVTTNNTLNNITVGSNEMKILADLAKFRELQDEHGRSKLPATEI
jgi:predicted transcriptional regulator